jgi:hypothetical protein
MPEHTGEITEDGWYVLPRDDDDILAGPFTDEREAYDVAEALDLTGPETEVRWITVTEIRAQQAADDYAEIDWVR